jgi:hypothetical protein
VLSTPPEKATNTEPIFFNIAFNLFNLFI